ncbi:MotA/TolQ/ExbB proton channel family protein [Pendulispora rubella]|uniref:MotA/TolQ/ExbB proton channel family protein n=1 Tax=Pendulispora rubella TaxID=2741070 RepID=A0ABZ2L5L2_9BACT
MIETMKNLMLRGGAGWVMWLLIGLSVISLAIAIERAWVLLRRGGDVRTLVLDLNRLLRAGEIDYAQELLAKSKCVEATVAQAGLAELERGPKAAEQAMAAARGVERSRLEERLGFLGTVGNNAPFVGLLGTVIGVVGAFEELGAAQMPSSALAPEKVMSAIAEALVATAMGLVVAIPAVAVFNYLQEKITQKIERAETLGYVVLAYLEGRDGR